MENLFNSVKSMFVNEEGGIKWATIIGIGAGAALGGFALPAMGFLAEMPLIAAAGGALVGLMGSQVIGGMGGESPQPAPAAGAAPAVAPQHRGHEQHQSHSGPGSIPGAAHGSQKAQGGR
jgi:hypothetical protein